MRPFLSPLLLVLAALMQGVDIENARLVFACRALVPRRSGSKKPKNPKPKTAAAAAAATPAQAAVPGDCLNGLCPADEDPIVTNIDNLSSRPGAAKKIWWV
jgi:hypothetical protein